MTNLFLAAALAAAITTAEPAEGTGPRTVEEVEPALPDGARRVAAWVAASDDNRELPYIIVDKSAARAFLFDKEGRQLGKAPVLIGMALGDDATPGIGKKPLERIGPSEKTTPAGRFPARLGYAVGGSEVLWVDYANSVALHTIPPASRKARTRAMLSTSIKDNRITYGCINVPMTFYHRAVRTAFRRRGGYVYVLPDTKALEEVFPLIMMQQPTPPAAP